MKKLLLVSTQQTRGFVQRGGLLLTLAGLAPAAFGQTFAPAVGYNAGSNANPLSLAVADVNGDSKPDIITANNGSSVIGVLLGNGPGTFQAVATTSTGSNSQPYGIAVADVNADGKPDVLTANYGTSSVGVLLGTGTGTFGAAVAYPTGSGSQPFDLAVADVNGDGRPDIISANTFTYEVGVLLNNGNGTFAAVAPYTTGLNSPTKVAVGDVNADGKADIVAAVSGAVGVLLGNGNGTFATAVSYATGSNSIPNAVAVADVSGDGKPDLISGNPGNYTVGVFKNNGAGTFAAVQTFSAGNSIQAPYDVVAVDVSGDGKPDIITANVSTNTVSVLLNTATFLATKTAALPAEVQLYPNPAATKANFFAKGLPSSVRRVEATLLNQLGQVVGRTTATATQGTAQAELPTAGLATGLYLLRLHAQDAQGAVVGTLSTQHLQVQ